MSAQRYRDVYEENNRSPNEPGMNKETTMKSINPHDVSAVDSLLNLSQLDPRDL